MPMTFEETVEELGAERAEDLRSLSLDVYSRAADVAEDRGIILCDTKFEFGLAPGGPSGLAAECRKAWKPSGSGINFSFHV